MPDQLEMSLGLTGQRCCTPSQAGPGTPLQGLGTALQLLGQGSSSVPGAQPRAACAQLALPVTAITALAGNVPSRLGPKAS